jgi:hypothetical protein
VHAAIMTGAAAGFNRGWPEVDGRTARRRRAAARANAGARAG